MKKLALFIATAVLALSAVANGERVTRSQYIDNWKDEAIYQMVVHKIPASVTLAQGILESGDGNSTLARKSNNHFGIKCHSTWEGQKVYHDDDKKGECFRKYPDAKQSYADHSDFLLKNRYASLFELKLTDYKGWAKGLKKCGYATSRTYAANLIDLIERHNLTEYDKVGIKMIKKGEVPKRDEPVVEEEPEEEVVVSKGGEDDDLPEVKWGSSREVITSKNRIQYVRAKEGDNISSLAVELERMPWQIKRYNDLSDDHSFEEGEVIYIQPKRGRCKISEHTVATGETLREISQMYGVKISKLRQRNNLLEGEPKAGTLLHLNRAPRNK